MSFGIAADADPFQAVVQAGQVRKDVGGLTVSSGGLVGITADDVEIRDSEVIDAAEKVAQLRLACDLRYF